MTTLRTAAQQALEALKSCSGVPHWPALQPTIDALRTALAQEKAGCETEDDCTSMPWCKVRGGCQRKQAEPDLRLANPIGLTPHQKEVQRRQLRERAEPLTIERLRDALVASRIIPPAAVEDPDEYDDGVMLHRIEALHRRLT